MCACMWRYFVTENKKHKNICYKRDVNTNLNNRDKDIRINVVEPKGGPYKTYHAPTHYMFMCIGFLKPPINVYSMLAFYLCCA